MILRAAMASNLISPIFRRRFLIKARSNLKRAICGPCLHTDMSLAALDRLGNRHRPNCTDAASAGAYQPVAALFRVRFS